MPLSIHRHAGTITTALPGTSGPAGPWVVGVLEAADVTVRTRRLIDSAPMYAASGSLRLPRG